MTRFDYSAIGVAVRPDLTAAHRWAWTWIAAPGDWWSGVERVAIADEVRRAGSCSLCARRGEALSPHAVDGEHDHGDALPTAAVDAVHMLANDASRITRAWFEKTLAGGLSEGHYVELLGVVVCVVSIDTVHRGLGLPPEPLPDPEPGEPGRRRPEVAREQTGFVTTIAASDAVGEYADLYPKAPMVANVIRALSLVPANIEMLKTLSAAHYVPHEIVANVGAETGRALSRPQIELIAGRVSSLNECFY